MQILLVLAMTLVAGTVQAQVAKATFETAARAEAIATITATCNACAWDVAGREAVVLSLALDGRYVQHLPIVRTGHAEYRKRVPRAVGSISYHMNTGTSVYFPTVSGRA